MGAFFLLLFLLLLNELMYKAFLKKKINFSVSLMRKLYAFHTIFTIIYYIYSLDNPSDSHHYYYVLSHINSGWLETLSMNNGGVLFLGYPLVVYLGFSYEMCMLFFAWFGFIGFIYSYLFFIDNINQKVVIFSKYDLLTVLLFFPNMHFWTVSLGKGSVIFMGIMMFAYAIRMPMKRSFNMLLGGFIVFIIRPHVLFFIILGVIYGVLFGKDKTISSGKKFVLILMAIVFLAIGSKSILEVANLQNSNDIVEDFSSFAENRSTSLAKSGSGLDMSSYPLPLKLFTFWFRPLFVDSPGALGLFSSFENVIYLLLFAKIANKRFWHFFKKAPYVVKMGGLTFLLTSVAMTFVMSNLGIIMRQKAQVMYFGFFVIYYFLAYEQEQKRKIYENQ